jgi:hypothetical protein
MRSLIPKRGEQQDKRFADLRGYFCPDFVIGHDVRLL